MTLVQELRENGLTNNQDIGIFSGYDGQRQEYEAICDSGVTKKCGQIIVHRKKNDLGRKYDTTTITASSVIKEVAKTVSNCPDCGYALFWKAKDVSHISVRVS